MSSPTTPNLNFNVPTPGGAFNTWGLLQNGNWTALDALLAGLSGLAVHLTGAVTASNFNGIRTVDGTKYTTIAQAIADLPAAGAFIIHLPSGYRETFTSHIDLGNGTTQAVFLCMDSDVLVTCNVQDGTYGFNIHNMSGIIGLRNQALTAARGGGSVINLAATANVTNVIQTAENPIGSITLQGFDIDNVLGGAVSNAFINIVNLNNSHILRDVAGAYFPHIGVHISSTTGGLSSIGPLNLDNFYFDGTGLPGARPLVIESDGLGAFNGLRVSGGFFLNPGSNRAAIEINGNGGTTGTMRDVLVSEVYTQQSPGTTTITGIKIVDAAGIIIHGGEFQLSDATTGHTGISIGQSGSGRTHAIVVDNFRFSGGGSNIGLNNTITGRQVLSSTGNVLSYVYGGTAGTQIPSGFIIDSDTLVQLGGTITQYNGVNTVSGGVPAELATVDTAQTAAIGTTTLYSVPAAGAGQYRLSWNAKVVTAAGTSSTLGALTIVYTDPDGVVQTIVAAAQSKTGAIETTDAGNSTTTVLLGLPMILNCKASTLITYAFAYASNAANAMNYNLHLKLEAM